MKFNYFVYKFIYIHKIKHFFKFCIKYIFKLIKFINKYVKTLQKINFEC